MPSISPLIAKVFAAPETPRVRREGVTKRTRNGLRRRAKRGEQ